MTEMDRCGPSTSLRANTWPTRPRRSSSLQPRGMPAQMIGHEGRDEVVAVVVAGLAPQGEGNVGLFACRFQQLGPKLLGEELVGIAVVHQQLGEPGAVLDQRD